MTDALFLAPVGQAQIGDLVEVGGDEGRHAGAVRRIRVGETVMLGDGGGYGVRGTIEQVSTLGIAVRVTELLTRPVQAHHWTAVQALAKGERSDIAIEAMTELGVDEIIAWEASRSVVRWAAKLDKGLAKWKTTAQQATKQCRRLTIPQVSFAQTSKVCARLENASLALVLHEGATQPLAEITLPDAGEIVFVIGPEGGISPAELEQFSSVGAIPVRISDAVLRTSTAGVVALAQLQCLVANQ